MDQRREKKATLFTFGVTCVKYGFTDKRKKQII
jgi:hypothetical protein